MTKAESSARDENAPLLSLTKPVEKSLTVTEIINAGESAGQTLGSPAVNIAVALLREQIYRSIATSQPKETQLRESAYLQLHALQGMLGNLKLMYDKAQEELAKIQDKPERDQREYLENQGFS